MLKITASRFNQNGRSMIEMLGVLAIIGVLSIGGIAGYSKAMYRMKLNKTLSIYNRIIYDIIELKSKKFDTSASLFMSDTDSEHGLSDYVESLHEICMNRNEDLWNGDNCLLPLGALNAQIDVTYNENDDGVEYISETEGYLDFVFTGPEREQACIDFGSQNLLNAMPFEMRRNIEIYRKPVWKLVYWYENKTSYTVSDVVNACNGCKDLEYCIVSVGFKW